MAVNAAASAGLTFQDKAVSPQGTDQFSHRSVAQEMDKLRKVIGHRITATTGTSMICTL